MGALAADRQPLAVTDALQATDLDLALDVVLDVATEVTFDGEVVVDVVTDLVDLVLGQRRDLGVTVELEIVGDALRGVQADAEDVGERDLEPLLAGDVDAGDTCHWLLSSSALPLLVAGVLTDDLDAPVPTDHTALLAHRLDARSDLHCSLTCIDT